MPRVCRPQRVFITGALGFIGSHLADRYRRDGAEVSGVDLRANPALGVLAGDIMEAGQWEEAVTAADLVIHTAARVSFSGSAVEHWQVNCMGTRNVLAAAAKGRECRLVHLSSIAAYGFDYPDGVDERYPLRPNGVPYVDSKVASEQLVLQAHASGEVACTIIRPGDVYGPDSQWTITPVREIAARRLILPAMGRGHLAPVFIDDLVEGIVAAANKDNAAGQVFNMTGGVKVETREFFGYYARMLGKRSVPVAPTPLVLGIAMTVGRLIRGNDVTPAAVRYAARQGGYSIEKARTQLGYRPRVDLKEGMHRSEEWLRRSGLLGN